MRHCTWNYAIQRNTFLREISVGKKVPPLIEILVGLVTKNPIRRVFFSGYSV